MRSLEDVREELASVTEELRTTEADDFATRARLRERQQELRAEAEKVKHAKPSDV